MAGIPPFDRHLGVCASPCGKHHPQAIPSEGQFTGQHLTIQIYRFFPPSVLSREDYAAYLLTMSGWEDFVHDLWQMETVAMTVTATLYSVDKNVRDVAAERSSMCSNA